ncbi:hypothetical protein GGI25_005363 [Coemansia spiralis]|uniref:Sulfhydryl oxidase n=2 Tax=Coemansia TaxID=4863 RepID=A0A9W8FYR7_9FUNG|nr:ERV/ALR sulfhydryl oxidase domain-containing protein [Coemansia spiralis]KAJ1988363.1 hypothetical protein EDC05_005337 [Coemansia umbellata]KAJ2619679.1 hypothetical protein GGI26_005631 [Coemansia sp. RSA 1358]KAJ2671812.1 hypothetical protein GGI25_005363 [Coemansia spiralis]
MSRARSLLLTVTLFCLSFLALSMYRYRDEFRDRSLSNLSNEDSGLFGNLIHAGGLDMWQGDTHVVMGKMGNETLRAQLGRRTWYLLHVMASRYPEEPTRSEQDAVKNFLFLMSRLYPCGDCAHHFQQHLKKYPPVVASRHALEQYLCNMHNIVNKSLKKPAFNCTEVHETYDCGCGPDNVRYTPRI